MRRLVAPSLAATLTALGVAACSTTSGPAGAVTSAAADAFVSIEQENELGRQMSAEVEQEVKLHPDPELQGYVASLGGQIASAAGPDVPQGIQFTFKVVDDDATVNAFAMPGGYVYVYTGLLRLAENEAEVVGVLGHEVAHVTKRHIAQRLVAQYGLQLILSMALGRDPGALSELAGGVAAQGFLLKYSRDHEREADHAGLGYTAAAGWDPHGFATFFQKMEALGGSSAPVILSTHPSPGERVESARARIRELGPVPTNLGRERYQEMVLARLGHPAGS